MTHRKSSAILLSLLLISGCARFTGIDPSMLTKTSKTDRVYVKNDFSWVEKFKLSGITHYLTLKKGYYKAYLDNGTKGTYYEGEGLCLDWANIWGDMKREDHTVSHRCGIFVPNSKEGKSLVYYYVDGEPLEHLGPLIGALDKAERNNLKHMLCLLYTSDLPTTPYV